MQTIVSEIQRSILSIADSEASLLVEAILKANKVFVCGAGRSGLMAKSFAMRMMHMGIDAYVIGETVTPNYDAGDLLIINSGSGETKSLISIAEKAQKMNGKIAVVTLNTDSPLASYANFLVKMPGASKEQSSNKPDTIQPMASLFEQTLLLFFDAVILSIMQSKGLDTHKMYGKHANLE